MVIITKIYNILYLVKKETYEQKMSRVRFHGIESISKRSNLKMTGIGWNDYDNNKTVQENINNYKINFDIVIAYKPLELKDFDKINIPKCIRFNEMYNFAETLNEIESSNADLVICHHENDMKTYTAYYNNYHGQKNKKVIFSHNPHCCEKTVFKDYKLNKDIDFLLCGRFGNQNSLKDFHYPIRDRMINLLKKLPKKYSWKIHEHPKYVHNDSFTNKYLIDFSKAINKAKICVTCTGLPKSRFGKYIEIPMSNSVIAGDIPDQDQDDFRKFVIEINMQMSDDEIIKKLTYYIDNKDELNKLRNNGLKWSKNFTQENYASRFIKTLDDFFNNNIKDNIIESKKNYNEILNEIKRQKKIYIQSPKENWVIDILKKEFLIFTKLIYTENEFEADIIWIMSDYRYDLVNRYALESKFVVTTIHHIDENKLNNNKIDHYKTVDNFTDVFHSICKKTTNQVKKIINNKKKIIQESFWVNNLIFKDIIENNNRRLTRLKLKYRIPIDHFIIGSFQRDTEGASIRTGNYKPKLSKGPDILLNIAKLIRIGKNRKFTVILTGYRRQWIIEQFKYNNIKFILFERVSEKILNDLFNCLDIYLISSRIEGGPRSLLEACISKTPILSTNVGISSEILNPNCIYDPNNRNVIIKKIKKCKNKEIIDYNYNKCLNYIINTKINTYDKLFNNLLDK